MHIEFQDIESFAEQLAQISRPPEDHLLIFLAAKHADQVPALIEALNQRAIPFFGALFPVVLDGPKRLDHGAIVNPIPLLNPPIIADMTGAALHWSDALPDLAKVTAQSCTLMIFADFMGANITGLLRDLYDHYANTVRYFGAGAGTAVREAQPVVFSPQGFVGNAAVVGFAQLSGVVTIRHGWHRIDGPFVANRTNKNAIEELDWEPATQIYQQVLQEKMPKSLVSTSDVPASKRYPFGIAREDAEDVVRDPLDIDEQSGRLVCLSDVPQNSVMYILHASAEDLINAATQAGQDIASSMASRPPDLCLLMDCYSRALLLSEQFSTEISCIEQALSSSGVEVFLQGAQALGEIASDGERIPEFHNKTVAVGAFYG